MAPVDTKAKLQTLRGLMKQHNVDIYVVPAGDCHASEYIADCDARRRFISGFSGTAGDAVITHDKAALSTDGRYFNQASQQLDDSWTLLKDGLPGVPTWQEWAAEQAQGGKTVAVDPELVTRNDANALQTLIEDEGGKLVPLDTNLIDQVWGNEQPARPSEPVFTQPLKYCGKSVNDKLTWLRGVLAKKRAAGIVITMLDEIAWLFNVRGQDLPSNPVFFSYAAVTQDKATIWVDKSRMDDETVANLTASSVEIKPYSEFFPDIKKLQPPSSGGKKFLISGSASWRVYLALDNGKLAKVEASAIADAKTVKTPEELEGMRQCHLRDGAAIIDYISWLEDQLVVQKNSVTEFEGVEKLRECREKQERYVGVSFATISCSGPNAAIMHYKPTKENCASIDPSDIYLIDSGGQYYDGTTDCTRTVHLGTPSPKHVEVYTRVLKALITLHKAKFPPNSFGISVDALARQPLWEFGMNYPHGTGHGVGSFLNVHEGPINMSAKWRGWQTTLAEGNVLSNEPGYYEDGAFGVRIEDMMISANKETKFLSGGQSFIGFENITVVPYCRKLIDTSLLTKDELDWLNATNAYTLEKTKPLLQGNDLALAWLERETQPYA